MPSALITAKGQTTIPKAIRDRLRVAPGDRIDVVVSVAAMHAVIRRRAAGR